MCAHAPDARPTPADSRIERPGEPGGSRRRDRAQIELLCIDADEHVRLASMKRLFACSLRQIRSSRGRCGSTSTSPITERLRPAPTLRSLLRSSADRRCRRTGIGPAFLQCVDEPGTELVARSFAGDEHEDGCAGVITDYAVRVDSQLEARKKFVASCPPSGAACPPGQLRSRHFASGGGVVEKGNELPRSPAAQLRAS